MTTAQKPLYSADRRDDARQALYKQYRARIEVNPALSRRLVSYQSNRNRPYYRWFKYKEGFSADLVEYVLSRTGTETGRILDPFAGSGAALFAGRALGCDVEGIELLPVGVFAVKARLASERVGAEPFKEAIERFRSDDWHSDHDPDLAFRHLPITAGAFPTQTENDIRGYRTYVRDRIGDPNIRRLFETACLCILESVSYTRKDGQYLRWDERAVRNRSSQNFNKGTILSFEQAVEQQLRSMHQDMAKSTLVSIRPGLDRHQVNITEASCLTQLPQLLDQAYDLIITSPPYCNRYDYTRTYALELAYLGVDEVRLKVLRQAMLSCTVENRTKLNELTDQYQTAGKQQQFERALAAFEQQEALQEVLSILELKATEGALNNPNIPRMIRNYFLESALVIFEMARVLAFGGRVVLVNDNVQYSGEEVPVDLILSDFAERAGLTTEHIWTLGRGKGNSSQQMAVHGRRELRKCAYVWQKGA